MVTIKQQVKMLISKTKNLLRASQNNELNLTIFALIFAGLGSYFLFFSHAASLSIAQTSSAPTIDGTLSESQWNITTPVAKLVSGSTSDTATWGALWDSNYLYVGVKVMDNSLNNGNPNIYDNDSVEVYVDPNADGGNTYDANDKQITQGWNNSTLGGISAATPGVLHAWATITGGYSIEMAIPWSSLGTTPQANNPINMDIGVNDSTGGTARTGQLMWNGTANNWQDPSGFGNLTLAGLPVGGTGDINGDGTVNITDLSLLLSSYGSSSSACVTAPQYSCDLNGDGSVNIVDLSILLSHFGETITMAPTASLSANPTSITSGGSSTLTWSSTNATSCSASAVPADANWSGSESVVSGNHTQSVSPTQTTTYSLSCAGSGGTVNAIPAVVTVGGSGSNIKPTLVGISLNAGTTGTRLKMRGAAVWGIQDNVTAGGNTGNGGYNDRQTIVNTIKAWGGNEIRLRVLACDYNSQAFMSNATELQEIQDWQTTAQAAGLYIGITWWDPSDCGGISHANWANNYSEAFPMITAVINKLGATNPWVFYEPFNEPNGISDGQWSTAMQATDNLFRSDGYTGILLMDTNDYSHEYNASLMGQLQTNDAGRPGMNGTAQIVYAKHDYSNEFPNSSVFDNNGWINNNFGTSTWSFTQFPVWETEFGNYNNGAENLSWSNQAATAMAGYVNNGTLVGATAFVWNWIDDNRITTDDVNPTQWGGYVKNDFLANVQ